MKGCKMASFTFSCPKCGIQIEVEDEWRGQQAQCPNCNEMITIPKPVVLKAASTSSKRPPVRKTTIVLVSILCFILAWIGVGISIIIYQEYFKRNSYQPPQTTVAVKPNTANSTAANKAQETQKQAKPQMVFGNPAANKKLIQGIKEGNAILVDEALLSGASLYAKDEYGRLIYQLLKLSPNKAVEKRIMEQIEILMNTLPKIRTREEALQLISLGLPPNYKYESKYGGGYYYTPLFECNTVDVVSAFIEYGAKVSGDDARDECGKEPLHAHAGRGHTEIVKLLLSKGADPYRKDRYEYTPLDLCKDEATRKVLIEAMKK